MLLIDALVCLALAGGLLAHEKYRVALSKYGGDANRTLVAGSLLLFLTSSLRVSVDLGLLPFFSGFFQSIAFEICCGLLLFAGGTLMAGGIVGFLSQLLPRVLAEHRTSQLFDFVRQFDQLAEVETSLDNLLLVAADKFVTDCGYQGAEVAKVSVRSGAARIVGRTGICEMSAEQVVHSVTVDGAPVARFTLYSPCDQALSEQAVPAIELVCTILSRRIRADELRLRLQFFANLEQLKHDVEHLIGTAHNGSHALGVLGSAVRSHLTADVVSVLWFQRDRSQMSRFTSTESGFLIEHAQHLPDSLTVGGWIAAHGSPVLITDVSDTTMTQLDPPLASTGVRSIVAVPLTDSSGILGALIVGSRRTNFFGRRQMIVSQSLAPIAERWLREMEIERAAESQLATFEKRIRRLSSGLHGYAGAEYFDNLASQIRRDFHYDMVRISAVTDERFVESLAFASGDTGVSVVPPRGTMVLSILDRHAEIIGRSGRLDAKTQSRFDGLSRLEIDHVLGPHCQAAEIRPLVIDSRIVGLLTIGCTTSILTALSPIDDALLSLVQLDLARAIESRSSLASPTIAASIEKATVANRAEIELRNRIRSTLTGILGGLELLQGGSSEQTPATGKYLEIIAGSARRMQRYLETHETLR